MKKYLPLAFTFAIVSVVLADNYKILQMNTESVRIGNRKHKKGDVFSEDSTIYWSKDKQAIKAQNMKTKEIRLFTEPEFRKAECKTIKDYYLKTNKLSSRASGLSLSELAELLNDTFYLLDSIRIESPIPLDSTRTYYIQRTVNGEKIRKTLPSDSCSFYIVRSLFDCHEKADEIPVSVFFSSKVVDGDYHLTDSMKIVLLPVDLERCVDKKCKGEKATCKKQLPK